MNGKMGIRQRKCMTFLTPRERDLSQVITALRKRLEVAPVLNASYCCIIRILSVSFVLAGNDARDLLSGEIRSCGREY